jgi:hypothetical protein
MPSLISTGQNVVIWQLLTSGEAGKDSVAKQSCSKLDLREEGEADVAGGEEWSVEEYSQGQ